MVNSRLKSHGKHLHSTLMVNSHIFCFHIYIYIENTQSINAPNTWIFSVSLHVWYELFLKIIHGDRSRELSEDVFIHTQKEMLGQRYTVRYTMYGAVNSLWETTHVDNMRVRDFELWEENPESERTTICSKRDIACSILTVRVLMHINIYIYIYIYIYIDACTESNWNMFTWHCVVRANVTTKLITTYRMIVSVHKTQMQIVCQVFDIRLRSQLRSFIWCPRYGPGVCSKF